MQKILTGCLGLGLSGLVSANALGQFNQGKGYRFYGLPSQNDLRDQVRGCVEARVIEDIRKTEERTIHLPSDVGVDTSVEIDHSNPGEFVGINRVALDLTYIVESYEIKVKVFEDTPEEKEFLIKLPEIDNLERRVGEGGTVFYCVGGFIENEEMWIRKMDAADKQIVTGKTMYLVPYSVISSVDVKKYYRVHSVVSDSDGVYDQIELLKNSNVLIPLEDSQEK